MYSSKKPQCCDTEHACFDGMIVRRGRGRLLLTESGQMQIRDRPSSKETNAVVDKLTGCQRKILVSLLYFLRLILTKDLS